MSHSKAKKKVHKAKRQHPIESKINYSDELKNRIALVTGSDSGLGRSIAIGLSRAGANVALLDIVPKSARETLAIIKTSCLRLKQS